MRMPVRNDVPPDKVFRTCNGVVLHNLAELKNYLDGCSEYDFRYHVNTEHHKNDFAIWVREVIHDERLAHDLDAITDQNEYRHAIAAQLQSY